MCSITTDCGILESFEPNGIYVAKTLTKSENSPYYILLNFSKALALEFSLSPWHQELQALDSGSLVKAAIFDEW